MGDDQAALVRLWQEKRGEVAPEDLSGNLIVQLGLATGIATVQNTTIDQTAGIVRRGIWRRESA